MGPNAWSVDLYSGTVAGAEEDRMEQAVHDRAKAAIKALAQLMPDRVRLSKPNQLFVEDLANKLNNYGVNAQVTPRQLTRLEECLTELSEKSTQLSQSKGGSGSTTR